MTDDYENPKKPVTAKLAELVKTRTLKNAILFIAILVVVLFVSFVYTQKNSKLISLPSLDAVQARLTPFSSISGSSRLKTVAIHGRKASWSSRLFKGSGHLSVSANNHKAGSDDVATTEGQSSRYPESTPSSTPNLQDPKFHGVLRWAGAPLQRGQPQWQKLDRDFGAFVYSAHFDHIVNSPVVRIVGIARQALPFQDVVCRFYYDGDDTGNPDGPSMHGVSVSGILYHFRNKNGRTYIGAFVDCPLSKATTANALPFAVSVNKGNNSAITNYMIIHRSGAMRNSFTRLWAADGNSSSSRPHLSNNSNNNDNNNWRWNITRCFPAFQRDYDKYKFLAEMVSASLAMGVNRFVFYVHRAGPNVLRMLQALEQRGLAEVYPWNIDLLGKDLFYVGQFSAIQDCLYRHLTTSRFLLFGDVDELFVPRTHRTLLPLLVNAFGKKPECGAYLFRNVFFNLKLERYLPPPKVDPSRFTQTHALSMLTHVLREPEPWAAGTRSKPATEPRKILAGSVHVIGKFREGFHSCQMDPSLGLLYHYRFGMGRRRPMNDTYLWNYTPDIIREMSILLRLFDNTVSTPYP